MLLNKGERLAAFPCPTRAADTMDVIFVGRRNVVVDDVRDSLDIDAARRDVRRHQHFHLIPLEKGEGFLPLALVFVTVYGFGGYTALPQDLRELLDTLLGATENEDFREFRLREEFVENVDFSLPIFNPHDVLMNAFRRVAYFYRNAHGIGEKIPNEPFDLARDRRGEKERVLLFGHVRENKAHVFDEAHVEHAISLIENDRFKFREIEHPTL